MRIPTSRLMRLIVLTTPATSRLTRPATSSYYLTPTISRLTNIIRTVQLLSPMSVNQGRHVAHGRSGLRPVPCALMCATVNGMDGAIFRVDIGLYIRRSCYGPYLSFYVGSMSFWLSRNIVRGSCWDTPREEPHPAAVPQHCNCKFVIPIIRILYVTGKGWGP